MGRGEYCDYPAEVFEIPSVQSGYDTNIEQIIDLEPEVLFMSTMAQTEEQVAQLAFDDLIEHDQTRDLEAAGSRARAAAHEHQQDQKGLGQLRPLVEVGGGEARGADDGGDLEIGVAQTLGKAADRVHDVQRNGQHRRADDRKVDAQLLALEDREPLADQDEVEEVEVAAEEQHEGGNHHFNVHAIEAADAGPEGGEAAGAGGGAGVEESVVKVHPAEKQENGLQYSQTEVDQVQDTRGFAGAGNQLCPSAKRSSSPFSSDQYRAATSQMAYTTAVPSPLSTSLATSQPLKA